MIAAVSGSGGAILFLLFTTDNIVKRTARQAGPKIVGKLRIKLPIISIYVKGILFFY
jgi:hypothetical protein